MTLAGELSLRRVGGAAGRNQLP